MCRPTSCSTGRAGHDRRVQTSRDHCDRPVHRRRPAAGPAGRAGRPRRPAGRGRDVAACASSTSASATLIGPNRPWKYSAAAVAVPMRHRIAADQQEAGGQDRGQPDELGEVQPRVEPGHAAGSRAATGRPPVVDRSRDPAACARRPAGTPGPSTRRRSCRAAAAAASADGDPLRGVQRDRPARRTSARCTPASAPRAAPRARNRQSSTASAAEGEPDGQHRPGELGQRAARPPRRSPTTSLVTREVRSPAPARSTCSAAGAGRDSTNRSRSPASMPSPDRASKATPSAAARPRPGAADSPRDRSAPTRRCRRRCRDEVDDAAEQRRGRPGPTRGADEHQRAGPASRPRSGRTKLRRYARVRVPVGRSEARRSVLMTAPSPGRRRRRPRVAVGSRRPRTTPSSISDHPVGHRRAAPGSW